MTARRPFAHRARIALAPGADRRAPGGAVTVALCGSWEHEPPCPLAPHHTAIEGPDGALDVRVVFAAHADAEEEVRRRIERALADGESTGPDGSTSSWRLLEAGADALGAGERDLGARLAGQLPD